MASPFVTYVVPNCGIKIEFDGDDPKSSKSFAKSTRFLKRSKKSALKYRVPLQEHLPLLPGKDTISFTGHSSPINDVTLPPKVKQIAGIPPEAAHFAYFHPPSHLAEAVDWSQFQVEGIDKDTPLHVKNTWAIPCFAMLGGFVYFNSDKEIIAVNAMSLSKSPYDVKLSGPFTANDAVRKELRDRNRVHPLALECYHEVGFVANCWIRPHEKFGQHEVSKDFVCKHGCFMFYKSDGQALVYAIEPSGFVDPNGATSPIPDVLRSNRTCMTLHKFVSDYNFTTDAEINGIREDIECITDSVGKKNYLRSLEDRRILIHLACKSRCSKETIESLLGDERENLSYQDRGGFTPLHHACLYQSKNLELIELLINESEESVLISDRCGRCPLHLACDSDETPMEVIDALIKADPKNKVVNQPTATMKRLPIHIACTRQLSKDAIACLLDADECGSTLLRKTRTGYLPLHLAVANRASTDVIKLLLETNIKERLRFHHERDVVEMTWAKMNPTDRRNSISIPHAGMLPLHIACWNNSPPETVQALLNADVINTTVEKEVGPESWLVQDRDLLDEEQQKSSKFLEGLSLSTSQSILSNDTDLHDNFTRDFAVGARMLLPLHLAAQNANIEVIDLLLQKEKQIVSGRGIDCIEIRDLHGRTPLAIASRVSNDHRIIESLLDLDEKGVTTSVVDDLGYKAIHYACEKEDASVNVVKTLLEAEDRHVVSRNREGLPVWKRSCDMRKRSPLYLAVKSGAPESVIEVLLQPENFYLKGIDSKMISGLSSMAVKNRVVQNCVIEKLTERCYFNLLFLDVYANACALFSFLYGSEKLRGNRDLKFEITVLSICILYFSLRQFIQIRSQLSQFFADIWNWGKIVSTVLLFLTARGFVRAIDDPDYEVNGTLLTLAGAFLIVQFTFFLRATFLPFARFVGGLIMIFSTLIPFFIVSSLLLLAFTYGFYIQGNDDCPNIRACYAWTLQGFFSGADETNDILDILFGLVAIVVLLNVVIAIVSDAWDEATNRAIHLFWRFRLEFLSEARFFAYLDKKACKGGIIDRWGGMVDNLKGVEFVDATQWSKEPYNMVQSKKQYMHPYDYFTSDIAAKIQKVRSLQADVYWTKVDGMGKNKGKGQIRMRLAYVILRWILNATFYSFLCVLGVVSAGWFWPKGLRKYILAIGVKNEGKVKKE